MLKLSDQMTYSQKKRAKMSNYREEYFRRNPGLFGCIWFCAYCHGAIIGKQNVQVDHIVPLNNPLGMNKTFNLVAACPKCNRDKSDKFDYRIVQGYSAKIRHSALFAVQKVFIVAFTLVYNFIGMVLRMAKTALAYPIKSGPIPVKLIAIACYAIAIILLLKSFM